MKLYGEIEKFDTLEDGSIIVSGVASSEAVDHQGESISADAIRKALPDYMQFANIREMHQPSAVGKMIHAEVGEDGKTRVTAKIVDASAIAKVKAGIYKGFSIGGKMLCKAKNVITKLRLSEISLVDRPTNPDAVLDVWKADMPNPSNLKIDMTKEELQSAISESLSPIVARLGKIEKAEPSARLTATIDGKEVVFTGDDIAKMAGRFAGLETDLTATKQAATAKERTDVIQKMQREGRAPVNPATGKGFTADDLAKCDLPTLNMLAANAPILPLHERSRIAKMDGKGQVDPALKGQAKVTAAFELETARQ